MDRNAGHDGPEPKRGYPAPDQTGKIAFAPPGTNKQYETAFFLYGNLPSKRTPLIGLHGGPGVPGRYLQPLAHLQKDHGIPVLLYDQIGSGESTRLPNTKGDTKFWTIELFIAELNNVIAHFGFKSYVSTPSRMSCK